MAVWCGWLPTWLRGERREGGREEEVMHISLTHMYVHVGSGGWRDRVQENEGLSGG